MNSAVIVLTLATFAAFAYGGVVPEKLNLPEVSVKDGTAKFTVEVRLSILWYFHKHVCNGALIDGEYIIVPAQCVKRKPWYGSFEVVVGSGVYGVRKISVHEKADNIANDIAVVRLLSTVTYSDTVLPINLPFPDAEYSESATLYKRGKDGEVEATKINLKSREDCTGAPGPVSAGHICAGDSNNSAVKGDEGSALAVSDGFADNVLIGLMSFAKAQPEPAVFTKISQYTDWILENLVE